MMTRLNLFSAPDARAEDIQSRLVAQYYAIREGIVGRMLLAWDFDAWGVPAVCDAPARVPQLNLYAAPRTTIDVPIPCLCRASTEVGGHIEILVHGADYLDESMPRMALADLARHLARVA